MFEELKDRQPDPVLLEKYEKLRQEIGSYESAALAFSGGVDSAFLLYTAHEVLGDRLAAITAASDSFPGRETVQAEEMCRELGVRHHIFRSEELELEGFAQNPPDRCYICKKGIFSQIRLLADSLGVKEVMEGTNLDDEGDYRPGMRAIEELGVKSPLRTCGLTKEDIRLLSAHFGLRTWNKQSFACLASRFPYGEIITAEKLQMVDRAEQVLLGMGFEQFRVRIHGKDARIEVLPEDIAAFLREDIRMKVYEELKMIGFGYVSLDLLGYRTGSMNEMIGESRQKAE